MTLNQLDSYNESFTSYDADDNEVPWHFECSICRRNVDDEPCSDHAPLGDLPGLRLVDCTASPRHYLWVHQREDYGVPCYACLYSDERKAALALARCPHRWWQRTHAWRKLVGWGYSLGFIAGSSMTWDATCDGCCAISRFGRSSYLLGVSRDTWHCWRRGHRRGEEVGFGFCGKCLPCPECGSEKASHREGCAL